MNHLGKKWAVAFFIIVALGWLVSCGGGDEQQVDRQQTDDSFAKQQQIDEANKAALEKAQKINTAPTVQILAPSNGAIITQSSLTVEWTAVDDSGIAPSVELAIRNIQTDARTIIMPQTKSTGSFSWPGFSSLSPGDYEIQLTATDGTLSNIAFARIKKQ